ncbi:hypothetical protein OK016_18430 [Vibrio chagasii]|nr:hypothetical protein [Vibrio chagasii]
MNEKPTMSMLIADVADLHLCDVTDADVYFKLPESFKKRCNKYIEILAANPGLIPWFPAVLIGRTTTKPFVFLKRSSQLAS